MAEDWPSNSEGKNREAEKNSSDVCPKCKGTGMVKEANGTIHVCFDCLLAGRLDVHSKKIPDSKIKI